MDRDSKENELSLVPTNQRVISLCAAVKTAITIAGGMDDPGFDSILPSNPSTGITGRESTSKPRIDE